MVLRTDGGDCRTQAVVSVADDVYNLSGSTLHLYLLYHPLKVRPLCPNMHLQGKI